MPEPPTNFVVHSDQPLIGVIFHEGGEELVLHDKRE